MSKLPLTSDKKINDMIKFAYKNNWRFRECGSGHIMGYSPDGKSMVTINNSKKKQYNIVKEIRNDFKKGGLKFPNT